MPTSGSSQTRANADGAEPGVAVPADVPAGDFTFARGQRLQYIPHMNKKKLERAGTLPWQVECREEAWAKGESALNELQAIEAEQQAARAR